MSVFSYSPSTDFRASWCVIKKDLYLKLESFLLTCDGHCVDLVSWSICSVWLTSLFLPRYDKFGKVHMRPSFSVWCIDVFLFFPPKIVECYWTRRRSLSPPCCRSWTGVETLRPSLPPSPPPAQEKDSYWGHFVWPTSTEVRPTAVLVHLVTNVSERENDSFLLLSAVFQDSSKFCLNSPRQVTSHLSCSQVGLFLSQTFTCIMSTADVPVSSNSYRPVYDFRLSFRKVWAHEDNWRLLCSCSGGHTSGADCCHCHVNHRTQVHPLLCQGEQQ